MFDLTKLINEADSLKKSYSKIKSAINSSQYKDQYDLEYTNTYRIIETLESKVETHISQLNPVNIRKKRGIINGAGSIIKAITGNLDSNDAERYDKMIDQLQKSQNQVKTIVENQLSLMETSIKRFQSAIDSLSRNQVKIISQILQIEQMIKTKELRNSGLYEYFLTHTVLIQLSITWQIMFNILDTIQTAITFSKLNTFHNSIVHPDDLLNELLSIKKVITNENLPFEPNHQNLLSIEKTINTKAYSKLNQITFVIEIPLVEKESYNYFHLYPVPTKNNEHFVTIIPTSHYLIQNEHKYALFNEKCKQITKKDALCEEIHVNPIRHEAPCEVQLIEYRPKITNCIYAAVESTKSIIQKIDDQKWIVFSPSPIVAQIQCKEDNSNTPLNGLYLIQIDNECKMKIQDTTIKTFQAKTTKYEPMALPKINYQVKFLNDSAKDISPINLEKTDLTELKNVFNQVEHAKRQLNKIDNNIFEYRKINVFTIILYVLIIFGICFAIFYVYRQKCKLPTSKTSASAKTEENPEKPSVTNVKLHP